MSRIICPGHADEPAPGGLMVCVEVQGAYTDGSSRHDRVFVPWLNDRTDRLTAVLAAHNREPDIAGVDLDAHAASPNTATDLIEQEELREMFETWRQWTLTRQEASLRGHPSELVTALAEREDAAWFNYVATLTRWKTAADAVGVP